MECTAPKEQTMEFPITFFQAGTLLILLGVLARKGLVPKDGVFTAYIAWFLLVVAGLWFYAQMAWGEKWYESAYLSANAVVLALATILVLRHPGGWHAALIGWLGAMACVWIGSSVYPLPVVVEAASCFINLAFGLYTLTQSFQVEPGFELVKLRGLGLFWLGQFGASAIYVVGTVRGTQPQRFTSEVAAACGAAAILWMALTLWFGGAEGLTTLQSEKSKKDEHGGWMQVAEWARARIYKR